MVTRQLSSRLWQSTIPQLGCSISVFMTARSQQMRFSLLWYVLHLIPIRQSSSAVSAMIIIDLFIATIYHTCLAFTIQSSFLKSPVLLHLVFAVWPCRFICKNPVEASTSRNEGFDLNTWGRTTLANFLWIGPLLQHLGNPLFKAFIDSVSFTKT